MIKAYFGSRRGFLRYIWYWLRYAVFRHGRNYSQLPTRIDRYVFVCKGNICRSPFAERVCRQFSSIETASFGLDTTSGYSAHSPVVSLAKSMNVDLSQHRTLDWIDFTPKEFDLYICVEPSHAKSLSALMPDATITLLGLFLSPAKPYIHDPYNSNYAYRRRCLRDLKQAVESVIVKNPVRSER